MTITKHLMTVFCGLLALSKASANDGIIDRSMMAQEALNLKLGDCSKIIAAWTDQFIAPLKKINAFVDQGALCIGSRSGAQFSFVINAEPVHEGDVAAFDQTIAELIEHQVHGIQAKFRRVSALTDVRQVTVNYRGKSRPVLVHDFEQPLRNFYAQFLELSDENRIFRKRNPTEFWARLSSFVPNEFITKLQPMLNDPIEITSWHSWRGRFDSGESVSSAMNTGNFRACSDANTPCVLDSFNSHSFGLPQIDHTRTEPLWQRSIHLGQKELLSGNRLAFKILSPHEL
jgi:hypothetical protein